MLDMAKFDEVLFVGRLPSILRRCPISTSCSYLQMLSAAVGVVLVDAEWTTKVQIKSLFNLRLSLMMEIRGVFVFESVMSQFLW